MEASNYGIVYVLTNPAMPGLVKIGHTTRNNFCARMNSLSSHTGVPEAFECEFACKTELGKEIELESALHNYFDERRKNKSREFFRVPLDEVVAVIRLVCQVSDAEEITDELLDACVGDEARARRPNLDFIEIGLKVGDKLTYVNDETVTCTVAGHRKVNYGNQNCVSLFSITKPLVGALRPAPYWKTENGITLDKLYNEHHNH